MKFTDKWGKKRIGCIINCEFCNKNVLMRIHKNRPFPRFCSVKCSVLMRSTAKDFKCDYCHKIFKKSKSKIRKINFCSRRCKDLFSSGDNHPRWNGGTATYRSRAIKKYGLNCSSGDNCPLKNIVLPDYIYEVDHIDGDRNNNSIDNLQVLCIWCHRAKTLNIPLFGRT